MACRSARMHAFQTKQLMNKHSVGYCTSDSKLWHQMPSFWGWGQGWCAMVHATAIAYASLIYVILGLKRTPLPSIMLCKDINWTRKYKTRNSTLICCQNGYLNTQLPWWLLLYSVTKISLAREFSLFFVMIPHDDIKRLLLCMLWPNLAWLLCEPWWIAWSFKVTSQSPLEWVQ